MPPLKLGFAGFGNMGQGHQRMMKFHPKLRHKLKPIAIFDPKQEFQEKARKRNLIVSDTFDDLINNEDVDALVVSSPPQFHCDQVVAGLEAGKHVFSEIPMALSEEETWRIINAEDDSDGKYQCGENYMFYAEVLYAAYLVDSGKIGRPVYVESEYLHDVTYRWREGHSGGPDGSKVESWYSKFDPLMYAHSIGPAQVAMGGLKSPMPFIEVTSYANDLGGEADKKQPVCAPSKAFHVALFKTPTGAIAKCANAYVIAREPPRMGIQVVGELGTFEAPSYGKGGKLFLADDHVITKKKHRKGKKRRIWPWSLRKVASHGVHFYIAGEVRIMNDWLDAIEKDEKPSSHARVAANMCMAGIRASNAARQNKILDIPVFK